MRILGLAVQASAVVFCAGNSRRVVVYVAADSGGASPSGSLSRRLVARGVVCDCRLAARASLLGIVWVHGAGRMLVQKWEGAFCSGNFCAGGSAGVTALRCFLLRMPVKGNLVSHAQGFPPCVCVSGDVWWQLNSTCRGVRRHLVISRTFLPCLRSGEVLSLAPCLTPVCVCCHVLGSRGFAGRSPSLARNSRQKYDGA